MKTNLSCLFVCLLLIGCDPSKQLLVKAPKKGGVSVTVYGNSNFDTGAGEYPSKRIRVPSDENPADRKKRFYYGFAGWSEEDVKRLAAGIDSIVFINTKSKTVLSTQNEIETYLFKHRDPFKLTIEAK